MRGEGWGKGKGARGWQIYPLCRAGYVITFTFPMLDALFKTLRENNGRFVPEILASKAAKATKTFTECISINLKHRERWDSGSKFPGLVSLAGSLYCVCGQNTQSRKLSQMGSKSLRGQT